MCNDQVIRGNRIIRPLQDGQETVKQCGRGASVCQVWCSTWVVGQCVAGAVFNDHDVVMGHLLGASDITLKLQGETD